MTIGNVTGATAVNVNSGTGACAWTTTNGSFGLVTGTGAINLGTDAAAKTLTIGNATGATSVVVNGGTGAMQFGANAIAHATTLGSVTGAAATTLQAGTGLLSVNGGGIVEVDSVGVLELNSSAGIIGIGNDAVAQNINIGTGAAARTITLGNASGATSVVVNGGTGAMSFGANAIAHTTTIGSTTGAAATVIQSGTGDITVTGTVKEIGAEFVTRSGDSITFQASPILQSLANTGAAPSGATGDVNLMLCQEGIILQEYVLGAGQTIIAPRMVDPNGLLISGDLTASEGYEIGFGANRSNSRHVYTIGTSAAFFFEVELEVADVTGGEPYMIGFRKVEAYNATLTSYTDYSLIGLDNITSPGNICLKTELNSGGTTNTNTTDAWADNATHILRVNVDAAGNTTYLIDGVAPSVTAAFQFDNGDQIAPIIRITHGAAAPGAVYIKSMKIGYQP